ncbi:MAG: hypothetical protein ACJAVK_001637 [Akkermansiaceae bacterium]|jgi:hypothetical protein
MAAIAEIGNRRPPFGCGADAAIDGWMVFVAASKARLQKFTSIPRFRFALPAAIDLRTLGAELSGENKEKTKSYEKSSGSHSMLFCHLHCCSG